MATILSVGDIAITRVGSDDPDAFAFVFLRNVEVGTTIHFTDNGWLAAGGFRLGEGTSTYVAPTDIAAGTVVSMPLGTIELDFDGDQVIAYQGTEASPTFLYAVDFANGDSTFAGNATDTATSAIPAGLALGAGALALPSDNAIYAGPTVGASDELFAIINNPSEWIGSDLPLP